MRCPRCSSADSRVIDSRVAADGSERLRRRECKGCGERFSTCERAADEGMAGALPQVVKRSGDREAFDSGRLRGAILRATEKRPVTAADVDDTVHRIRRRLPIEEGGEVLSARIGEWVMEELRTLDRVAYVRFAAGRRRFVDLSDLPRAGDQASADGPAAPPASSSPAGRTASGPGAAEARGPQLPLIPRE